ncbi:MAG: hypothetical protein HYY18_02120 [Planctomycetes bacterium]|nr:hypothetical protein [Planctomycetota bacterium]
MKRWLPAVLMAALLCGVVGTQAAVDRRPEKKELTAANPYDRLPPSQYVAEYSASMLMGGMRAVAIDYLWIQFIKAERERRFVEVNAILEMIAYLQPTFAEIWKHLAWVKAYNIAAMMETREDRWLWVKGGLDSIQKAVDRNPADEGLWFYKAYLHYHRLPQEAYLLDRFRDETGQDAWEVSALTMEKAIVIAQDKGRDNTRPPGDGMMQDAYFKWAFAVMRRGEHARARQLLRQGHDTYFRLTQGRPVTDMNEHNNRAFLDLAPVFELEEKLAAAAPDAPETAALRTRLLQAYLALELTYVHIQPIEQRIIHLFDRPFAEALDLARQGKAAAGAALVEKELVDFFANLEADPRIRGGAKRLWADMAFFAADLQRALEAEARGEFDVALKKYDELPANYRYALPSESPQFPLVERRAAELRNR